VVYRPIYEIIDDYNYVLYGEAACKRVVKAKYIKRKRDAAALGKTIDDMLTADEREMVEIGYYNQFKKLLLHVGTK